MLVPRRAAEQFSVRAAGDIVVGDTILFTERLLVDRGGNGALLGEPARGAARPLASNALCWSINRVKSEMACCSRGYEPSPPSSPGGGTSEDGGATSVISLSRFQISLSAMIFFPKPLSLSLSL